MVTVLRTTDYIFSAAATAAARCHTSSSRTTHSSPASSKPMHARTSGAPLTLTTLAAMMAFACGGADISGWTCADHRVGLHAIDATFSTLDRRVVCQVRRSLEQERAARV